jgi:tRNA (cytidine/uridine-2'-O-)-methyltransferase
MTTPLPGGGFTADPRRASDLNIVLVEPEIHWNTGNAGRTCLAAGATLHLVAPLGFSLDERQVRRAGLDYWDQVRPVLWASLEELEAALPGLGPPVLFTSDAPVSYWNASYPRPVTLIFGRESTGLPPPFVERHRESRVGIPMRPGSVRSLNLSTAVALGTYEVLRKWRDLR